ncbi:hypothetical protein OG342_06970 [Streptomyces bobili]|uniref:hypothetical protein n=1 Tax=Streptomyces bobili TaxID=67280 RepID=UPI0022564AE2|nr:hypothetical protein [Streptomyces bobili]MCX5522605.1 hypothetical protein [Streptomyces bobili]
MQQLPEPPAAPAAGQNHNLSDSVLQAAVDHVIEEAKRHDSTPQVVIGTAPPVPQPGRPPMSQRAVDASTIMLSASAATIPPGAITIGVMLASGYADPIVIGMICAAPAAVAVPIIALARLLRGARPAGDIHHHYEGTVHQQTVHSSNRGVWAKTDNRQ